MDKVIEAKYITFRYKSEDETETEKKSENVLENLNISFEEGSFTAILGHNGCGKSTFAKMTNAILIPDSGNVEVNGFRTDKEENLFDVRCSVGMVFQNPDNQIVAAIVEDDVAFGPENLGIEPEEIRRRVRDALESVGMIEYKDHSPSQLSGGQKQRVAIAGIIAMRPKCIVLDEPTAMLDPLGRKEVMKTLHMLREKYGITIILITHYMDEAAQCDRVVVMDRGRIVLDDVPKKVFSKAKYLRSIGLDVPQVTQLFGALKKDGFDVPEDVIDENEAAEVLYSVLK